MIALIKVTDPDGYAEYIRRVPDVIKQYGGTIRARGGRAEVLEGTPETGRVVVIEFPSFDQVRKFWHSPEYEKVKVCRQGRAKLDVFVVEGV
jgi:uncharacterized protein (DUF1330 family)